MARVYLAYDRLLDREVAVKVLSEPYASDPQFVERFRREASAAAGGGRTTRTSSRSTTGEADIVMEYLSGPDLKRSSAAAAAAARRPTTTRSRSWRRSGPPTGGTWCTAT